MNFRKLFLTENACYKAGGKIIPKGIMVHSTGANNPWIKRYVGPDDGILGVNTANNHWNHLLSDGRKACVHAFIGKIQDGSIATYQTLPWTMMGWHSGSGPKGNANKMGYIGFEICEDSLMDKAYFNLVYQEAVELCARLCREFNLNPLKDGVIICHSEGAKRGIAENHADVMHWFPKFRKTMDMFRTAVAAEMEESVRYPKLKDIPIEANFRPIINDLMTAGIIGGDGSDKAGNNDVIDLSHDMVRMFVFMYRAGSFDNQLAAIGINSRRYK